MSKWIATRPAYGPDVSCCYALYLEGALMYIGQTINLKLRMYCHKRTYPEFWSRLRLKYRIMERSVLLVTEKALIRRLKPSWNRVGTQPVVERPVLICPGCDNEVTAQHLRESPECMEAARSFVGIYSVAKRKTPQVAGPGRPRRLERCQCGAMTLARAAQRNHKCPPRP